MQKQNAPLLSRSNYLSDLAFNQYYNKGRGVTNSVIYIMQQVIKSIFNENTQQLKFRYSSCHSFAYSFYSARATKAYFVITALFLHILFTSIIIPYGQTVTDKTVTATYNLQTKVVRSNIPSIS